MNQNVPWNSGKVIPSPSLSSSSKPEIKTHIPPRASKAAAQFEVSIGFSGIDDVGLVNAVTRVISADMRVDMRAISFETRDGIFEGQVRVVVSNTEHLSELITKLQAVPGVYTVERLQEEG